MTIKKNILYVDSLIRWKYCDINKYTYTIIKIIIFTVNNSKKDDYNSSLIKPIYTNFNL